MLEAKAKARPGRGQAKAKSAKTSDYRVLERELKAKVVFLIHGNSHCIILVSKQLMI